MSRRIQNPRLPDAPTTWDASSRQTWNALIRLLETSHLFNVGQRTLPEFHIAGSVSPTPVTLNVDTGSLEQVRRVLSTLLISLKDTAYLDATKLSASTSIGSENTFWMWRILTADQTLTDDTSTQNLFSTNSSVSLLANATYEFELLLFITQGTASSTVALSFDDISGGTIAWRAIGSKVATNSSATTQTTGQYTTFTTARNLAAASTVAGLTAHIRGTIRTGASGGIFRPRVTQTAASGAFTILRGTYARIRRIGTNTLTNTGEWT